MSTNMIELPDGTCATESEALTALTLEARRRGISYGKLAANTTAADRVKIVRDYCKGKRQRKRRKTHGD